MISVVMKEMVPVDFHAFAGAQDGSYIGYGDDEDAIYVIDQECEVLSVSKTSTMTEDRYECISFLNGQFKGKNFEGDILVINLDIRDKYEMAAEQVINIGNIIAALDYITMEVKKIEEFPNQKLSLSTLKATKILLDQAIQGQKGMCHHG